MCLDLTLVTTIIVKESLVQAVNKLQTSQSLHHCNMSGITDEAAQAEHDLMDRADEDFRRVSVNLFRTSLEHRC